MGYFLQIRRGKTLIIPEESGYVPPNPGSPSSISLSAGHMGLLLNVMTVAGLIDRQAKAGERRRNSAPGLVPAYKFCLNDGYVITARDADHIARVLHEKKADTAEFFAVHFPTVQASDPEVMAYVGDLLKLWMAFNSVAAANNGYTIR